jgi:methyl-accepting chemotaxis protein
LPTESSIRPLISLAAAAERCARLLTSDATTAKPRPCSPARAGEQGRGFAVVASEVRSLAQRSALAAKEIKGLIDDSVQQMDSGTVLVQRAGTTMEQVVASVRRVRDVVGEISASSVEQHSGIEEINKAIVQIDETTQRNAALVEEAAAAAASLQEQAAQLTAVVSRFQLAGMPRQSLPALA